MKKVFYYIIIFCFALGCGKVENDNPLDLYVGEYNGERVVITHFREYDPIFNQYISKANYDTVICRLNITVNDAQLDIKEYNDSDELIKFWHGVEINSIGELAYLHPDTTGYGEIKADTFSMHLTFPHNVPPDNLVETTDTLFHLYFLTAIKQ